MPTSETNDFITVIRSAGERTKEACAHITSQEMPVSAVHIIELSPFEAALRKCYEIGIRSEKKWMITIDADVLPRKGFVSEIAKLSEQADDNVIMFNAMIHDKLFMQYRTAGFKVYRTEYLGEALQAVPRDGEEVRPEAATLNKMTEKGFRKKNFNYVVGLHDHQQYYRDIYRKAYFHSTKHIEKLFMIMPEWKEASKKDTDYLVALKGAVDGLISEADGVPDIRFFAEKADKAVQSLNLSEKEAVDLNQTPSMIETAIEEAGPFLKSHELKGIKREIESRGLLNGTLWSLANIMEASGKKIKKMIE